MPAGNTENQIDPSQLFMKGYSDMFSDSIWDRVLEHPTPLRLLTGAPTPSLQPTPDCGNETALTAEQSPGFESSTPAIPAFFLGKLSIFQKGNQKYFICLFIWGQLLSNSNI